MDPKILTENKYSILTLGQDLSDDENEEIQPLSDSTNERSTIALVENPIAPKRRVFRINNNCGSHESYEYLVSIPTN